MKKIYSNRLSHVIAEADIHEIKTAISTLKTKLGFLLVLSDQDIKGMKKVSNEDKTYMSDVLTEMGNAPDLVPAFLKVEEIEKDLELLKQLSDVEALMGDLQLRINRNRMLAADEGYTATSLYYGSVKTAARGGVPGASEVFKRLQEFHKKRTKKDNGPASNENPANGQ